jgi:hypothetical protein
VSDVTKASETQSLISFIRRMVRPPRDDSSLASTEFSAPAVCWQRQFFRIAVPVTSTGQTDRRFVMRNPAPNRTFCRKSLGKAKHLAACASKNVDKWRVFALLANLPCL